VALKSSQSSEEKTAEIEEALDALDKLVDRLRVIYEQYFMGIQKQAPTHQHTDVERRIREVAQLQIRNTALRYRFATVQQKFGAYNTYWKRTLRDIEAGRYLRNLSKLRRQAVEKGESLPEEILAAMPKRMRESIERDRAAALADARRRGVVDDGGVQRDTPADTPAPTRRGKSITTDPFAEAGDDDIAAALSGLADEALAALDGPTPPKPHPMAPPPTTPRPPPPQPRATAGDVPPPRLAPSPAAPPPPLPRAVPLPRPAASGPPPPSSPPPPPPRAPPPPARPPGRPASSTTPPVPGMTEAETRSLYAKFVKAREVVGDKSEGFTYDKLVRTLQSQAPKILEQHKSDRVEWSVVIRDNKVILKAKPK
jgi:hypothetical protein